MIFFFIYSLLIFRAVTRGGHFNPPFLGSCIRDRCLTWKYPERIQWLHSPTIQSFRSIGVVTTLEGRTVLLDTSCDINGVGYITEFFKSKDEFRNDGLRKVGVDMTFFVFVFDETTMTDTEAVRPARDRNPKKRRHDNLRRHFISVRTDSCSLI